MYHNRASDGLILDWAAFDGHAARAGDRFRREVRGWTGRRRSRRLRFGTFLGNRVDLKGEWCSCEEDSEYEAKRAFPQNNLHFKFWLGTEFRANAVFGECRGRRPRLQRDEGVYSSSVFRFSSASSSSYDCAPSARKSSGHRSNACAFPAAVPSLSVIEARN